MQQYNKILIFEIYGDYGHFKKPYTTTSPLTFSFPPKPSVAGIIGAIIGIEKNYLHSTFKDGEYEIGLKIVNPVSKTRIATNLIDTKKSFFRIEVRNQIKFEVLKNPYYKIYFRANSDKSLELMNSLYQNLSCRKPHYTVSLGLSQMLCNFKNPEIIDAVYISEMKENIEMDTVIIKNENYELEYLYNHKSPSEYYIIKMPHVMDDERIVSKFSEFYFEPNAKKLKCLKAKNFWKAGTENVVLF